ncbi:MAG: hypothetical protein WB902_33010 [Acetobacteraceae bacterium]
MEVTVCVGSDHENRVATLLRDPLIRLVMISDGVTEQAMVAVMEQLRQSLAARQDTTAAAHRRANCSQPIVQATRRV